MSTTRPDLERALETMALLDHSSGALRSAFIENAQFVKLPPGHFICMEGDVCGMLPVVVSGQARVFKSNPDGREITLYRIESGECCILTASCIIGERRFPAFAVTETDVEAVVIPTAHFHDWCGRYEAWRSYIFAMVLNRLSSTIEYVEEIAFKRLDERLAAYLGDEADDSGRLRRTHEQIASDLGTSREAVSRALKDLENEGLLTLGRGTIGVSSKSGLVARARRS